VIGNAERVLWPAVLVAMWIVAWFAHVTLLLVALGLWTGGLGLIWLGEQTGDAYRFVVLARLAMAAALIIGGAYAAAHWPDR
jgi:hypothetical protein